MTAASPLNASGFSSIKLGILRTVLLTSVCCLPSFHGSLDLLFGPGRLLVPAVNPGTILGRKLWVRPESLTYYQGRV